MIDVYLDDNKIKCCFCNSKGIHLIFKKNTFIFCCSYCDKEFIVSELIGDFKNV